MQFGEPGNDNLVSRVSCLVDSGAGCLAANLRFIEGLIGMNPAVLVEITAVSDIPRGILRSSQNWRLSKGFCDPVLFDYVSFI